MKILSWNINGFRASVKKGSLINIIDAYDVVCLQEVKIHDEKIIAEAISNKYAVYSNLSESSRNGVAVICRAQPKTISKHIGDATFDREGRFLRLDFDDYTLINLYMPHGGRDKSRLKYKLAIGELVVAYLSSINNFRVIVATDFNIATQDIDVEKSKSNRKNIMFTTEERHLIKKLGGAGYTDAFRHAHPGLRKYSWWTYAHQARERNIGWRIDYIFVTQSLENAMREVDLLNEVLGSDHCPVMMHINIDGEI